MTEANGAKVNDQIGLSGTVVARKALTSSEIDMYWEYTGTKAYNFDWPSGQLKKMQQGVMYQQLDKGAASSARCSRRTGGSPRWTSS